ncbi:MAG TPA: hypothetical protein VFD99_06530 [Arthrobacter sp.]|jgi:hypothetical protein|nr:hypothetical protein [Arthrobacter sp.]
MLVADDIVIDPEEAPMVPARTSMSLSELGISVFEFRPGESSIEGTSIRTANGQRLVDRKEKPTTIEMILEVAEDKDVDLPAAAYRLQQKFGSMQERETWIMRVPKVGGSFAGPILYKITGVVSLGDFAGWGRGEQPDVRLVLERDPVGYSTEEDESETFSTTTARQLIYSLGASGGTANGLRKIRVTNSGSVDWRGLIWAEECRDAPDEISDPTADLAYQAKNLTPKGGAAKATVSGAEVIQHTSLTAGWVTILYSKILASGHMTHRGPRRMWMRIYDPSTEAGNVQLHLHWRPLGASRWIEDNLIVPTYVVGNYSLVNLGDCRPKVAALGEERWEWKLLARAVNGAAAIRIRDVYLLPTEQYLTVATPEESQGADSQERKSPGTGENITGAGTVAWSSPSNALSSNNLAATMSAAKGTSKESNYLQVSNFAFGIPEGATITGIGVEIERKATLNSGADWIADAALYLMKAGVKQSSGAGKDKADNSSNWPTVDTYKAYGGSADLWANTWTPADVNNSGFGVAFRCIAQPATAEQVASVDHIRVTVYYTEAEDENRVCFATRSAELRGDRVDRQHPTDDVWGELIPDGFQPYATAGGLEGRQARGIVIASQGDLAALPDSGTPNKASAVVWERPGYHFAREPA